MLYDERKNIILQQLTLSPILKIPALSCLLQVSVDTIRRDLKNMEADGLLECVRGGARRFVRALQFSDFRGREIINIPLKLEAVRKAISFVQNGDVIMLNSGTTNTILAQELAKLPFPFTVISNNIAAVTVLMQSPLLKVIVAGGDLNAAEQSLYGYQCEVELAKYHPDLCFLSINAVNAENGFTDFRFHEIPIMQVMQKSANKTVAVMDSSKLGTLSKKMVFTAGQLTTVVMDNNISETARKHYAENGIEIL